MYPSRKLPRPEFPMGSFVHRTGSQEQLSGYIDGQKASDLEERFSRSLKKMRTEFVFRMRISSLANGSQVLTTEKRNSVGELEIDFLIPGTPIIPVMLDGEIAHFMTPHQRDLDAEKAQLVNEFGKHYGWKEAVRVPYVDIQTQAACDVVAKQIIEGTYVPRFAT